MALHPAQAERCRRTAKLFGVLGCVWAVIQVPGFLFPPIFFGNGFAFAIYASVLYSVRCGKGDGLRAVLMVLLGMSHVFWVFAFVGIAEEFGIQTMLNDGGWACLGTGVVLGSAVCLCSWNSRVILPIVIGTVVSVCIEESLDESLLGGAIMALHLGLIGALLPDTLARIPKTVSPWICASCGYDCRGITSGVCPECGHELVSGTVV